MVCSPLQSVELLTRSAIRRCEVRSPGGYETWSFLAHDPTDGRSVLVRFAEGGLDHPDYEQAMNRFMRRPTRVIPPVPTDFPSLLALVYGPQMPWPKVVTQTGQAPLETNDESATLKLGAHAMTWHDSGAIDLTIRHDSQSPAHSADVALAFTPVARHAQTEWSHLSLQLTGTRHGWLIADGLYTVNGTVDGQPFHGTGYHARHYGAGPINQGVKRLFRGAILLPDRAIAWTIARGEAEDAPDESTWLSITAKGVEQLPFVQQLDWTRWSLWARRYPSHVQLGGHITLSKPTVLLSQRSLVRLNYAALVHGQPAVATAEVLYM